MNKVRTRGFHQTQGDSVVKKDVFMNEMQIFYTDGHQEHRVSVERLVCELPDGRRLALWTDDNGRGQWRLLLAPVHDGQDAQCLGVFPLAANMIAVRPLEG